MQNAKLVKRFIYLLKHETQLGSISFVWKYDISGDLSQLIKILLAVGALLHIEKNRTYPSYLNVYINYQRGISTKHCANPYQLRNTTKFLHHQTLYRFLLMRPGAVVLMSTQLGLITASECIKRKVGGFLFCSIF